MIRSVSWKLWIQALATNATTAISLWHRGTYILMTFLDYHTIYHILAPNPIACSQCTYPLHSRPPGHVTNTPPAPCYSNMNTANQNSKNVQTHFHLDTPLELHPYRSRRSCHTTARQHWRYSRSTPPHHGWTGIGSAWPRCVRWW